MINTHEKLFESFVDMDSLYNFFKEKGYKGEKENLIGGLIWGFNETSAYTYYPKFLSTDEDLTEDEYFEKLVYQMNRVV